MYILVYVSSARQLFSTEELQTLLAHSRAKNERLGITGLLLYKGGNFMQVLEGEEDVVKALYAHIRQDPRHGGFLELIQTRRSQRLFPDWSMAFRNLDDPDVQALPGYSPFLNTPLTNQRFIASPDAVYKLLHTFKQDMR